VRGAVAPSRLQLQYHLPGGVAPPSLVGQRRAGDVAAQLDGAAPVGHQVLCRPFGGGRGGARRTSARPG
jgi:hypothetical protein